MAFGDGSGFGGLGFGGFDLSDFLGITGNEGFGNIQYDPTDNALASTKLDGFATQKNMTGQPTFKPTIGLKDIGINTQPASVNQSTNGYGQGGPSSGYGSNGMGGWVDAATKLGAFDLAHDKDKKNEKYRKDVFNFNAREKNDKNQRDRNIQSQLTGGKTPLNRADQPYM